MRLTVHPDVCVGSGQCVLAAGSVFDQGEDDGLVVLRRPDPTAAELADVREAVARCPVGAIELQV